MKILTEDSGQQGTSGDVRVSTGRSLNGHSGKIEVATGDSLEGEGGGIRISVGTARENPDASDLDGEPRKSNGGDLQLLAGDTEHGGNAPGGNLVSGGNVRLAAGHARAALPSTAGATGGFVEIKSGNSYGADTLLHTGGEIFVAAGNASSATGGAVRILSGGSYKTSSGDIHMSTQSSGDIGVSGGIHLTTGSSTAGDSGSVKISTGTGKEGRGGDIILNVGDSQQRSDTSCFCTESGADYRGIVDTTTSGKSCQVWASQYPHEHSHLPEQFPEHGLGSSSFPHNYCRNPSNDPDGPWCYTTDLGTVKEYCNVSRCEAGYDDTRCISSAEVKGGNVLLSAGNSADSGSVGGLVNITAGSGLNSSAHHGGSGGGVHISGGTAHRL